MQKKLKISGWLVAIFFLMNQSVIAAQEFHTQLDASYLFEESSPAKVELNFKLTNTNPTVFVSNYQITVPEAGVSGLVLQQKNQTIVKEQKVQDGQNIFDLTFENEVVGQGKSREFSLEYTDDTLRKKRGHSQSIKIPPLQNSQSFSNYQTRVTVPTSFGTPDVVTPTPVRQATTAGQVVYTFNQQNKQSIALLYGQEQFLQFNANYVLENQTNTPQYREIILPSDQDDLQVIYANLWPSPEYWQRDSEGNWRGYYLLKTGEELAVLADGFLILKNVEKDFVVSDYFPQIMNNLTAWNIESIPADFLTEMPKLKSELKLRKIGLLPLPGFYQLEVQNESGRSWNLQVMKKDLNQVVEFEPMSENFELLPWQKTVIIGKIKNNRWWQPYAATALQMQILDQTGKIINENHENGIAVSYVAFASVGGILAAAVTAGSVLVARRQKTNSLRRQSEESQKETEVISAKK